MSGEFPCPNCRKADGIHLPGCLTLLARQLDKQIKCPTRGDCVHGYSCLLLGRCGDPMGQAAV